MFSKVGDSCIQHCNFVESACRIYFPKWENAVSCIVISMHASAPDTSMKKTGGAVKVCANCGSSDDVLRSCSRCKLVHYCGQECQTQHWKAIHKKDCKTLEKRIPEPEKETTPLDAKDETRNVGPTCVICLEIISCYEGKLLPCKHFFHIHCIERLMRTCSLQCPLCRDGPEPDSEEVNSLWSNGMNFQKEAC